MVVFQRMMAVRACNRRTPQEAREQITKYTKAAKVYISKRRLSRLATLLAAPKKSVLDIT